METGIHQNHTVNVRKFSCGKQNFTCLVLSAVPLNLTGSAISADSLFLSWLLPPTPGISNVINHYVIRVTELFTSKVMTYFSVEASATVSNLHPYYYYNCQVAFATTYINPFTLPIVLRTLQAGEMLP